MQPPPSSLLYHLKSLVDSAYTLASYSSCARKNVYSPSDACTWGVDGSFVGVRSNASTPNGSDRGEARGNELIGANQVESWGSSRGHDVDSISVFVRGYNWRWIRKLEGSTAAGQRTEKIRKLSEQTEQSGGRYINIEMKGACMIRYGR